MLTRRPGRLATLAGAALLAAAGCGEDRAPPPGVSTGRRPIDAAVHDGGAMPPPPSPRPDGAAILPPAEAEVTLEFGGEVVRYPIEVEAEPRLLDVHLSIDTSGSIGGEIDALQRDLGAIVDTLRERVPNLGIGVSRFEDFPEPPFGSPGNGGRWPPDTPFRLLTPITSDEARVASAVASLDQPLGDGGDGPESGAEALWQIATGAGYEANGERIIQPYDGRAAPGGGTAGGVGFREGALRVVLHVTDAPSHQPEDYGSQFPDTHDLQQAAEALSAIDAKVVAIVSGACAEDEEEDEGPTWCREGPHRSARRELEQVALLTGAFVPVVGAGTCPFGLDGQALPSVGARCPLVFDVSGSGDGLTDTVTDAIVQLVDGVRFAEVSGGAGDDPLAFIHRVVPTSADGDGDAPAQIADLLPAGEPDGEPDTFVQVRARARLRFDVELRNTRIRPSDVDQRFRVVVRITGDGLTLAEHTLRVRVPAGGRLAPERFDAGAPDSGAAEDDAGG